RLVRGRNVLALELTDVLGRRVEVRFPDGPAQALQAGEHTLQLLADFYHDPSPPRPVGDELRVEYGQPARLRLRTALPFGEGDLLKLAVGGTETPATAVHAAVDGSEVEFKLPFDTWRDAAGFEQLPRDEYAAGRQGTLVCTLHWRDGQRPVQVPLRT